MSRPFPSPRLTAACLAAAVLILLAGYLVTPWESETTTTSYHEALAESPERAQIAAVLLHFGWLAWAPAAFGIVALLSPRGGWLLRIAGTLAIIGTVSLPGLLITDFYDLAIAQELPRELGATVSDRAHEFAWSNLLVIPSVVGAVLGTTLLFFAVWRAGVAPAWTAFAALAGQAVTFAAPVGLLGFGIGGALTAVAGLAVAHRLMGLDGLPAAPAAPPAQEPAPAAA